MQRLHRFRFGGQSARLGFSFRSGSTALDHWWRCVHAIDAASTGTIALHRPRSDLIIDRFDGAAGRHRAKVISFSAIRNVAGRGVYDFVRARKIQTEALPATLARLTILKSERWASALAVLFFHSPHSSEPRVQALGAAPRWARNKALEVLRQSPPE